jgi:Ran GTPase-activating protein (RanGAP) involved in mRNA processing and transport
MLEKIKSNSLSALHIATYADDVFDEFSDFLEALQNNTSLDTIHLEKDFIGDLRSEARENLLKSLGSMKHLKELTLADGLLQISHVTKMVQSVPSLRTLRLKNLVLQGIESDFDACEAALYQHPGIKEFEMENCGPALDHISINRLNIASQKFAAGTISDPTLNAKSAMTA